MKTKIKQTLAIAMLAGTVGPAALPVVNVITAHADDTTSVKEGDTKADSLIDAKTQMTTVVAVNGNKLVKDKTVNPGDTVTFDIVYTPGNKGLMTDFTDTLPVGLKFNPNSKFAVTVFAVNNDGTVGDEITDKGKGSISGKTYKWVPTNPKDYFFLGKTGTQNRVLFHITTVVENGAKDGQVMKNVANGTTDNPKQPGKPEVVTDEATVKIPDSPKDPSIHKSVYLQDEKGGIDLPLPGAVKSEDTTTATDTTATDTTDTKTDTTDTKTDTTATTDTTSKGVDITISSEASVADMKASMAKLVALAKENKVDSSAQEAASDSLKDDATDEDKVKFVASFKTLKEAVLKVVDASSTTDGTDTDTTTDNKNDNIDLKTHDDLYTYVVDVNIPSQSVQKKLTIQDPIEHVQTVDAKDVHIYNYKGEEITSQGEVSITETKGAKTVNWKASDEFVANIAKDNKNVNLQMRIQNVTLKGDNKDDEAKYETGGIVSIPNVANLIWDKNTTPSNETIVRVPEDPEKPNTTIRKSVALQKDGKIDKITNPYQKEDAKSDETKTDTSKSDATTDKTATATPKDELATLIKEANELVKKDGLDENTVALLKSHTQVGQGVVDDKDAKAETIAENIKLIKAAMTKLGWTESTTTSDTSATSATTDTSATTATTVTPKEELTALIKEATELVKQDGLDADTVALLKSHTQVAQGVVDDKAAKDETVVENIKLVKAAMTKLGWKEAATTTDTSVKQGDKVAAEIDFERGNSTINLPKYDSYYKYMVETSINPDDAKKNITLGDNIENIQADSIEASDIKIYDATGADVTESFKVSVDKKFSDTQIAVNATANKDLVKKVHSANTNSKFQMVIYNVKLSTATKEQTSRYTHDGQLKVPNIAYISTDGKHINSNETIVTPPKDKTPDPAKPTNPKADIKTGLENVAKSPLFIITLLAAAIGGTFALVKTKKKHQ